MKLFKSLLFFSFLVLSNASYGAYCSTGSLSSQNITPESFNQSTATFNSGRRAFVFSATAGCTYTFSTCGTTSMDTYLRLYSGAGGTLLVSADDNCGTQSQIVWTCSASGTYSVLLTRYSCNLLNSNVYMNYSKSCPTPCAGTTVNLTMNDSWGDGWNGGSITLTNNSGGSYGPYTIATGSTGSQSLCLPDGCYNISVGGGSYPDEMSWSLSNGISGGGYYGTQNNVFTVGSGSCGPIVGCMDPNSLNYNPAATVSDGSCYYGVPASGSTSLTMCSGTIYDNGGPSGVYATNSNGQLILYPASAGATLQLNFTSFDVENSWDYLYIYNGNSTAAPLIGTYTGATAPTQITSTAANGALTLVFTSDGSVNYNGFSASVLCVTPPPADPVSITASSNSICAGNQVTLTANGAVGTVYWFAGACSTTGAIGTGNSITLTPSANTTYYARNFSNGQFSLSCASTEISIKPLPVVNAGPDMTVCPGSNVQLNATATEVTGSRTFTWSGSGYDNNNFIVGGTLSGLPSSAVITGITYDVSITSASGTSWCPSWYSVDLWANGAWQTWGCNGTYSISSLNGLNANGQVLQVSSFDEDVFSDFCYITLTANVSYSVVNTIVWSPATGLSSTSILNPVASISSPATYTITATADGCSATDQMNINITPISTASALVAGDVVWNGSVNTDWLNMNNWSLYTGAYSQMSAAPSINQNVVIPANQACVLNQPNSNANTANARNLTIESGATLTMGSGNLNVAGNWLNDGSFIPGTGNVTFAGNGTHTISGSASTQTFNGLEMNKNGEVQLSVPVSINGNVTLTNGLLNIGVFDLDLPSNTIIGGSAISYIKTSSSGVLKRNVAASMVNFPVGKSTYNPAELNNSTGTEKFSVRVVDNVADNGNNADSDPTTTMAVVNRTWMIDEEVIGGSDATVRLYWNPGTAEEINGFTPIAAFMAHYSSSQSMWDNIGGAVMANYVETNGNSDFSPFTISSDNSFAPLPVELISFTAQCQSADVLVKWSTASEYNSQYYLLQVSDDGLNWSDLEKIDAAGFSNTVVEYNYLDKNGSRTTRYYRLLQFDNDGEMKMYNTIIANCSSKESVFMTFPNPSADAFTVVVNDELLSGSNVLTISDASGKTLYSLAIELENGSGSFALEGLNLPAGLYYLQMNNGFHTSRIIKHSFR